MNAPEPTLSPAAEIEGRPLTLRELGARVLSVPRRLFGALVLPDRVVPAEVQAGRYGAALVAATLAALALAFAVGARVDVSGNVQVSMPVEGGKPGEEALRGEHEIAEDLDKAQAIQQVMLALKAGFGTPALILLLGVGLYLVGRYVGGRPTMRRAVSLAALVSLPGAVRDLLATAMALRAPRLTPAELPALGRFLPLPGPLDPFLFWAAVLCVLGFPALASVSRTKAVVTVSVCFVLYLCLKLMGGAE